MKAKAKDDNTLNVTAYATAEQLKDNANFALSASYKGAAKGSILDKMVLAIHSIGILQEQTQIQKQMEDLCC